MLRPGSCPSKRRCDWISADKSSHAFFAIAAIRSAIQNLITDWRVIPNRSASRSICAIIHRGKSTLTRWISKPGRRLVAESRYGDISTPASCIASNCCAVSFLSFLLAFFMTSPIFDPGSNSNWGHLGIKTIPFPSWIAIPKRSPGCTSGALQIELLRAAVAAACIAGVSPAKAAYSSSRRRASPPLVQSE